MDKIQAKHFSTPDEVREFGHGRVENLQFDSGVVGQFTLEPGWKWSNDVKPIAGTDLCEVPHFAYQLSGRMIIRMADGSEREMLPGEVGIIPPGHDAWVVGNEAVVLLDWTGATSSYAKPAANAAAQAGTR